MDKKYDEYVEYYRKVFDNHKGQFRKIDGYPVYFHYEEDGIWFKFQNEIIYHHGDNMTLKDIKNKILENLPFIESVQFYDEIACYTGVII